MGEKQHKKVSPPFEGGVAGSTDYLTLTKLNFPAGVVDFIRLLNSSTSAEVTLWVILKSKKLEGRKFRRQYSIGRYIVDFCCPSEKLILELDGNPHGDYHRIQKNENRDKS